MAIDPVCKMALIENKAAEKIEFGGKVHFFCSKGCRDRFEKEPGRFLAGKAWKDGRVGVAYFSMEIGLDPGMPTYSGGLGVLAGDTIRSARLTSRCRWRR